MEQLTWFESTGQIRSKPLREYQLNVRDSSQRGLSLALRTNERGAIRKGDVDLWGFEACDLIFYIICWVWYMHEWIISLPLASVLDVFTLLQCILCCILVHSTTHSPGRWLSPNLDVWGQHAINTPANSSDGFRCSKLDHCSATEYSVLRQGSESHVYQNQNLEKRQGWRSDPQPLSHLGFLKLPTFASLPFAGENTGEGDLVATFLIHWRIPDLNLPRCILSVYPYWNINFSAFT